MDAVQTLWAMLFSAYTNNVPQNFARLYHITNVAEIMLHVSISTYMVTVPSLTGTYCRRPLPSGPKSLTLLLSDVAT